MKVITRTIWILSLVSLFTDIASEMLYPVIPVYLKSLNYSVLLIGILEGFAEVVSGLSKGYFGNLSDKLGRRVPFVRLGYAMSALSKPLMAMFTNPAWIFTSRSMDRLGKGVRTAARDAMLSDETTPEHKGKVFGFHRSFDTLGAVIGPIAALIYLYIFPGDYVTLFYIAFIPGVISISFTFLVKDKATAVKATPTRPRFRDFLTFWKSSPDSYKRLVKGLLFFALINSSDMFLILRVKAAGLSDTNAIGVYIFYNLVYAAFSYPLGRLGDRIGLKKIFISGLVVFALIYLGMALTTNLYVFMLLFFIYGIYTAATDGISKAWISNTVAKKDTGSAIGTYTGFQSICSFVASSVAGLVWFTLGDKVLFFTTGIMAIAVVIYFIFLKNDRLLTSGNKNM
jgi:MFS family permease